jgi:hypothetical protein
MFDKDKVEKSLYAALDLGQRTIRAVLKRQDGRIKAIFNCSVRK